MRVLKHFRSSTSGNVAVLFALSIVPLCGFVALSIDYTRTVAAKERIQSMIDTAALSVAALPTSVTPAEVKLAAQRILDSTTLDGLQANLTTTIDADAMSVTISAMGTVNGTFARVIGFNDLQFAAFTRAQRPRTKKADIALVLDNTGSMCEPVNGGPQNCNSATTKLKALKDAVSGTVGNQNDGLTGILRTSFASRPNDVRVSVVPFSLGVMIEGVTPAMAAVTDPTPAVGSTICITDRPGNHDLNGVAANVADPDTFFRQKRIDGSWIGCPQPPSNGGMAPLSSDLDDVDTRIFAMVANGWTNAPVGLFWGRQSIVPGGLLPGGAPLTDTDLTRYLILLTDGDNTRSYEFNQGSANDNPAPIDDKMIAMCTKMRGDDNVILYTIGFGAGISNAAKSKLAACAGSPDRAKLAANAGDLNTVFAEIAADVVKTRLLN